MSDKNRPSKQTLRRLADRAEILRLVLAAGVTGISSARLTGPLGRSRICVGSHLTALAAEHKIERSHTTGQSCKWGPPGTWAHYQGARDREDQRRHSRRRILSDADYEASLPYRRTLVPAAHVAAIETRPPNSVWEVAQRCAV